MICRITIDLDSDNWDIRFYKDGKETDIWDIPMKYDRKLKNRLKEINRWYQKRHMSGAD